MQRSLAVASCGLLLWATGGSARAQESGEATGKKIGTAITSALDAALPGVTALLGLIWPKDKNEIKKNDLEKAVAEARKTLLASTQQRLVTVALASEEFTVVNRFLEPSVLASQGVIQMQTRLASEATPSDATWALLKGDWELANIQLKGLAAVSDAELEKVGEFWLRDKLKKIRDANKTVAVRVTQYVTAKTAVALTESLAELERTLADIVATVGYELAALRTGLKAVADWGSGGSGPLTSPLAVGGIYKQLLDERYP